MNQLRMALLYAALSAGALAIAFPFFWMLTTSFKTLQEAVSPDIRLFPAQWQWDNLRETFEAAPFAVYFYNTFLVSFTVTASVVVTSLMAGYAFARLRFPGRTLLFGMVLATMMIPFEIMLIPNYVIIWSLGWYDTFAALIVPWCANAFSIFLMRQAFLSLPPDFFDAAKVDGCGHLRFLAFIAAPLVKPVAVTVALFAFLGSYNALLWPRIVMGGEPQKQVVQVGLTVFSGDAGTQIQLLMCASSVVILPTVALYFLAQRYFLESAIGAGLKG